MIAKIKHYLDVFSYSLKLSLKIEAEYTSYLFCWLFMIPLELFGGLYVLQVIMERIGTLNGWTFGQVAFLYGLGVFSHGLQDLFFIQTRNIEGYVIYGEFDRMLLRPLDIFFQFCFGEINLCGIITLLPGVVIFGYGCYQVGFQWTFANILLLLAVIIGGTLIQAAIFTLTGSIAFWTKKSQVFVGVNLQLFDKTTQWPMAIYPKWFAKLFSFLIPMGFVSFYPTCGLLGIDSGVDFPIPLEMAVWTPVLGIVWFVIAVSVFKYGLRTKYESSGS